MARSNQVPLTSIRFVPSGSITRSNPGGVTVDAMSGTVGADCLSQRGQQCTVSLNALFFDGNWNFVLKIRKTSCFPEKWTTEYESRVNNVPLERIGNGGLSELKVTGRVSLIDGARLLCNGVAASPDFGNHFPVLPNRADCSMALRLLEEKNYQGRASYRDVLRQLSL
ncbi:hypothetical protein ACFS07_33810 [Undibacterium arcticum]